MKIQVGLRVLSAIWVTRTRSGGTLTPDLTRAAVSTAAGHTRKGEMHD